MTPSQVSLLKSALHQAFGGSVDAEKVGPRRYRFAVVSDKFSRVPQLKRQDQVWEVADRVLPAAATLDISLILVYAPDEIEQAA